jgi:pimeloyl-ACP methyl ester carboxylesterase
MLRSTGVGTILPVLGVGGAGVAVSATSGTVVMIHGAFAGGWCFERFRAVFEGRGWVCHSPDLRGHGNKAGGPLDGIGLTDYRDELVGFVASLAERPVLLGHSMGAVLAQQLAAAGLARALVLVSPAPRSGILPDTDSEKAAAQGLMSLGPFWTSTIPPNFEVAANDSLNCIPPDQQRAVFDRFGPESGRALFELFFWMIDRTRASAVDVAAIRCPVLCVAGSDDKVVSLATAQATAAAFAQATFLPLAGHGHMLLAEPGAEGIARLIAEWAEA